VNRILAIDAGTQSLRACILDRDLTTLERGQASYTPQVKAKTWVEINAEVLWDAFMKACGQLRGTKEVEGISFSTLCPSLVPMDADGNPLAPMILHLDRRSYRQALWALDRVGEERFLRTAGNLPIPGGISLTSLLWIKEHEPSVYHRRDVVFGHGVTFFMKRLTGGFFIDPSNASFTGLYDTVGYGDWDEGILGALEIEREKLPQVALSPTIVGELDGRVAASTGLSPGIPVVIGANDTTCAAVGAGVTEHGKLINSTGTVDNMVLCLNRPLTGKNHLLRTHAYRNRWLAMRTVGAGGASVEWFRKTFCQEMTRDAFYNEPRPVSTLSFRGIVIGSSRKRVPLPVFPSTQRGRIAYWHWSTESLLFRQRASGSGGNTSLWIATSTSWAVEPASRIPSTNRECLRILNSSNWGRHR
jgi:sugar (pentulose or hexulose) kinase